MAGIRVKLNQYREELQESVEKQEFSKAAELKQQIASLEQERADLQEEDEKISSASIREERVNKFSVLNNLQAFYRVWKNGRSLACIVSAKGKGEGTNSRKKNYLKKSTIHRKNRKIFKSG